LTASITSNIIPLVRRKQVELGKSKLISLAEEIKIRPFLGYVAPRERFFLDIKQMLKAQKVTLVDNLIEELKDAKSLVLVNYTGLNVKSQQELKKRLKEAGARMVVVKNTLLKRAIESAKIDNKVATNEILSGQTALVIADEDPVTPIQILGKFAKENELPKFKVGIVDGTFSDESTLVKISTLPSKDVLLSQVLGSLISPMYGLVGTLNGNMQKLVYILKSKAGGEN
jgi:large subunit ribosomal protein L10